MSTILRCLWSLHQARRIFVLVRTQRRARLARTSKKEKEITRGAEGKEEIKRKRFTLSYFNGSYTSRNITRTKVHVPSLKLQAQWMLEARI